MKGFVIFIIGLSYITSVHAQKPSWQWATYPYNSKTALVSKVANDPAGNVYSIGNYTGSITLGDSSYISTGMQGIYLAKYNRGGNLLWSKNINGTGAIAVNAVTADANGNVYVGGSYINTIRIGDSTFSSIGWKDMFIVKYTSNGSFSWAKSYGTLYDDQVVGMAVNSKYQLIVDGYFCGATNSPPLHEMITFGNYTITSHGDMDPFIMKCDSNANVIWAKNPGGNSSEAAYDLVVDKNDNVYITGDFDYGIFFDTIIIYNISSGFVVGNVFLAKYDSAGNALWARAIGGYKSSSGSSGGTLFASLVTVDTSGNPIVGGNYTACDVIFDKFDYSTSLSGRSMWVAKYSSSGNFIWSRNMGGSGREYLYDMACDKQSNLYLTGEFGNGCVFDSITLTKVPARVNYMFVTKYNNDGRVQWVQTAGDTAGAVGNGLAVNNPDEVVVGGQFYGNNSIKFGNATCYNTGTTGNGFVAKMSKSGVGVPHTTAGQFSLSPNPSTDEIQLHMQQPGRYNRYVITNTIGSIVSQGKLSAQQEQTFPLPDVPAGLYYLTLSGNKESVTQKLSIQH